jgi:hypothetical protein
MSNRIAGIATVKYNGTQIPIKGKWKFDINPTKREGIAGQDSVHGYKEMPKVPHCQGDVSYTAGVSIETLRAIDGATVTLELANGRVIVFQNAWYSDTSEVDTEEGSFPVKFESYSAQEI